MSTRPKLIAIIYTNANPGSQTNWQLKNNLMQKSQRIVDRSVTLRYTPHTPNIRMAEIPRLLMRLFRM